MSVFYFLYIIVSYLLFFVVIIWLLVITRIRFPLYFSRRIPFSYSTTISARVSSTTLIIICKELIALESSTSPFNLPVNAGLTEETGPNATMARVWRTSKENGARK